MKVLPLAIFHSLKKGGLDRYVLFEDVYEMSSLTHTDMQATFAAYFGALMVGKILEKKIDKENASKVIEEIISEVEEKEKRFDGENEKDNAISKWVRKTAFGDLSSVEKVIENSVQGFHSRNTIAFVVGCFLRNLDNFEAGVVEAVNAGGDTDTQAAIVASWLALNNLEKIGEIKKSWFNWTNFLGALRASNDLTNVILKTYDN
jgi:ADP-ribosylglycohydrolase